MSDAQATVQDYLREGFAGVNGRLDRLSATVLARSPRMTSMDATVARLHQHVASLHGDFAGQSAPIDRIEPRLERIERRLDIVDAR